METESLDRKKVRLDTSNWILECVKGGPKQHNIVDCGMFVWKFADCISRRVTPLFEEIDMPYYRRRMVYEILKCHCH